MSRDTVLRLEKALRVLRKSVPVIAGVVIGAWLVHGIRRRAEEERVIAMTRRATEDVRSLQAALMRVAAERGGFPGAEVLAGHELRSASDRASLRNLSG